MIKVSITGMVVSLKTDLRFPIPGQQGHEGRIIQQLEKDAVAFQEEKLRPKPEQYTELLDARIQIRPTFREKLIEQLKGTFGEYYDYHYRDIATHEVDDLNMEDPYSFSHRTWELEYQRKQELQKKHPVQSRQKSHNTEL